MAKLIARRVLNSENIWCLIVDDCPIGTATQRDGIASATVVYDDEIKYFNSDISLNEVLSQVTTYVRGVEQYYNEAAEAELCKVEYHNEVIAPMEHAEREAERTAERLAEPGGWCRTNDGRWIF